MNRLRVWGLTAAAAAGLGGLAWAGDPNIGPDQTTLMQKLFGPHQPKPSASTAAPATPATINAPLSPEVLARCLRAEQEAYLRRVSVCTELRRVAEEKGDADLSRQADAFEREAASVYNARVAALGVSRGKSSQRDSASDLGMDEPAPLQRSTIRTPTSSSSASTGNHSDIYEVKQ
jgi:hypothetical protein